MSTNHQQQTINQTSIDNSSLECENRMMATHQQHQTATSQPQAITTASASLPSTCSSSTPNNFNHQPTTTTIPMPHQFVVGAGQPCTSMVLSPTSASSSSSSTPNNNHHHNTNQPYQPTSPAHHQHSTDFQPFVFATPLVPGSSLCTTLSNNNPPHHNNEMAAPPPPPLSPPAVSNNHPVHFPHPPHQQHPPHYFGQHVTPAGPSLYHQAIPITGPSIAPSHGYNNNNQHAVPNSPNSPCHTSQPNSQTPPSLTGSSWSNRSMGTSHHQSMHHHHHHAHGHQHHCSHGHSNGVVYVYELPYDIRKSICDLLDADNSWRELGGRFMGFNDTQLALISHALYRSASPTNELLIKWESSNAKVSHLFAYLDQMKHHRAMYYLLPFVNDKLRKKYETACIESSASHLEHIPDHQSLSSMIISAGPSAMGMLAAGVNRSSFRGHNHFPHFDVTKSPVTSAKNPHHALHHANIAFNNNPHSPTLKTNNAQRKDHFNEHHQQDNSPNSNEDSENTLVDIQDKQQQPHGQMKNNIASPAAIAGGAAGGHGAGVGAGAGAAVDGSGADHQAKQAKNPQEIDYLLKIDDFKITYKELVIATDDFCKDNILGSGGFGTVFIGDWKGTKVAIKKLKGLDNLAQALTELRILNCCRIDNILPLYAVSLDGPEPCLVYQYMPNGSLEDRLLCKNNTVPLTWIQRSNIAEGVARALNFLHTLKGNPFVHGDVKSANILLDPLFEPKLGDFGLARQVVKNSRNENSIYTHCTVSSVNGTSVYLPAEYLRHKILSPAVDVYSYGIVILEMATGKRAYDGKKLLINTVEDEYFKAQQQQMHMEKQSLNIGPTSSQTTANNNNKSMQDRTNEHNHLKGLMDKRIAGLVEGQRLFHYLLELGRRCAHKTKSKRPIMIQVLEYFNQCRATDRIYRLCQKVIKNKTLLVSKSNASSKLNIKNPIELQLWYDFVKKSCGTLSDVVFENFGAQVTNIIEDIVSNGGTVGLDGSASDESTFCLDLLLNSKRNPSSINRSNNQESHRPQAQRIPKRYSQMSPNVGQQLSNNAYQTPQTDQQDDSTSSTSSTSTPGTSNTNHQQQDNENLSKLLKLINLGGTADHSSSSASSSMTTTSTSTTTISSTSAAAASSSTPSSKPLTINEDQNQHADNGEQAISLSSTPSSTNTEPHSPLPESQQQAFEFDAQHSTPFIPLLTALGFNIPSDIDCLIDGNDHNDHDDHAKT